jgi:hypothetical protein
MLLIRYAHTFHLSWYSVRVISTGSTLWKKGQLLEKRNIPERETESLAQVAYTVYISHAVLESELSLTTTRIDPCDL